MAVCANHLPMLDGVRRSLEAFGTFTGMAVEAHSSLLIPVRGRIMAGVNRMAINTTNASPFVFAALPVHSLLRFMATQADGDFVSGR